MTGLGQSILEEGRAEGKAEIILDLLADFGGIPSKLEERIREQDDGEVFRRWVKLAARAGSVEQFEKEM